MINFNDILTLDSDYITVDLLAASDLTYRPKLIASLVDKGLLYGIYTSDKIIIAINKYYTYYDNIKLNKIFSHTHKVTLSNSNVYTLIKIRKNDYIYYKLLKLTDDLIMFLNIEYINMYRSLLRIFPSDGKHYVMSFRQQHTDITRVDEYIKEDIIRFNELNLNDQNFSLLIWNSSRD